MRIIKRYVNIIRMICRKLRNGLSAKEIAGDLEEEEAVILQYCEAASVCAPEYDGEKVWDEYKKKQNIE